MRRSNICGSRTIRSLDSVRPPAFALTHTLNLQCVWAALHGSGSLFEYCPSCAKIRKQWSLAPAPDPSGTIAVAQRLRSVLASAWGSQDSGYTYPCPGYTKELGMPGSWVDQRGPGACRVGSVLSSAELSRSKTVGLLVDACRTHPWLFCDLEF